MSTGFIVYLELNSSKTKVVRDVKTIPREIKNPIF
jgi:hypothetical protein